MSNYDKDDDEVKLNSLMQFIKETVIVEYSKYTASLYTVYTVYIT